LAAAFNIADRAGDGCNRLVMREFEKWITISILRLHDSWRFLPPNDLAAGD